MLMILSCSVIINLKLTFKILSIINSPKSLELPLPFEKGDLLPEINVSSLNNDKEISLIEGNKAKVLLFLSSGCPKCKEKLPEIEPIIDLLPEAGLDMFFIGYESRKKINKFLALSPLSKKTFIANSKSYKKLNPNYNSPSYIFTNHSSEIEALGTIGDENWLSFIQQMQDFQLEINNG
jgi:hypothetical protein